MTKRNGGALIVGLLVSIAAGIASCSFPAYDITVTGGSGGAASATGSSGSVGGGGASSSGTTGTTSSTGTTSTSTSSSTSSTSASSSSSTGTGAPCVGDGGACDCDDDKSLATTCANGKDCNDHDPLVHPGQTAFFKDKIAGSVNDFDYDCDGIQKYEVAGVLDCTNGTACDTTTLRWKTGVPACGVVGQIGKCVIPGLLQCAEAIQGMVTQRCH
jgi:hypothetical protein